MAVRLHGILPEYQGQVRFRIRPFPLEAMGGEAAPRDILEQEWWLAALQEPSAPFAPYRSDDWPTTTLPAFEAAWCAAQQGEEAYLDYDLRIRRAFFAESRNIGRREVLFDLAREAGLDLEHFTRAFASGEARAEVLKEANLGRERYGVRGTPTLMLPNGNKLRLPIAFPHMRARKVVGVQPLPCCGESCMQATRALIEEAIQTHPASNGQ
jgi:predicted DsbA family dithiol-disulfide isomerase